MDSCKPTPDPLLAPYLGATYPDTAERRLDRLLAHHAVPLIDRVIWRKCGRSPRADRLDTDAEDARDACGEALAQLVARLRACRASPDPQPAIQDFRAEVLVTAHRAWYRVLRQRNPRREALRSQIRYLLAYTPGLALWEDDGRLLGGLTSWSTERRPAARPSADGIPPVGADLRPFLFALFCRTDRPAELGALVSLVDRA